MKLRRHPRRLVRRLWPRARPAITPRLTAVAPEFARELELLLTQARRPGLVASIPTLEIFGRCPCSDLACASFFTAPWREDALTLWVRVWTTIPLPAARGEVSIDVTDDGIVAVEVLNRRDVWLSLARLPLEAADDAAQANGRQ